MPGKVILQAVMGSHAYGMNHAMSDEDRKGVYVASTIALAGLEPPQQTFVRTDPDYEFHEVGKFFRLALKCNPTILEELYVTNHEICTTFGRMLIDNRDVFLSRERVKGAFGGYALDQMARLKRRGDGSFSSDVRNRREKHARHCFRLLLQGRELLEKGKITVKVENPEWLFAVGRLNDAELEEAFQIEDAKFMQAYKDTDLQEQPDRRKAAEMLAIIRAQHL